MKKILFAVSFYCCLVSVVNATETTYYSAWASGEYSHTDPVLACDESLTNYKAIAPQHCGWSDPVLTTSDSQCWFSYNSNCTSTIAQESLGIAPKTCTDPQIPTYIYTGSSWRWSCEDPVIKTGSENNTF